jgi:hypothetical protein
MSVVLWISSTQCYCLPLEFECAALLTMPRPRNALSLTVGVVALIRHEIEVTLLDGRQSWGQIG